MMINVTHRFILLYNSDGILTIKGELIGKLADYFIVQLYDLQTGERKYAELIHPDEMADARYSIKMYANSARWAKEAEKGKYDD